MKREIIQTEDGSTTIRLPDWDECYHSKHGAIQESHHVFIKNGLSAFAGKPVSILEIGFGTGLNALVTYLASNDFGLIDYVGVEAYPISNAEVALMNYPTQLGVDEKGAVFQLMHDCAWEKRIAISERFSLAKHKLFFQDITFDQQFDLIYFDAFGYRIQPELWSEEIFKIMYRALKKSGILVTYAARGIIKRNMQAAGFRVEKLAGPPGKREMMRAFKDDHNENV